MNFPFRNKHRGVAPVVAVVALLAAGLAAWFLADRLPSSGSPGELSSEGVAFEVADAAQRELDGSPALALSFSLPLDAKADLGPFLQVLEIQNGLIRFQDQVDRTKAIER